MFNSIMFKIACVILLCFFIFLLPIFPLFLIMSKGRERCMLVCIFPIMFKVKQTPSKFFSKMQIICFQGFIHLGGAIHLRGRNHFISRNIRAYKKSICHHKKGGECKVNLYLIYVKMF